MSATPAPASSVSPDTTDDEIQPIFSYHCKTVKAKQRATVWESAPVIWINGFPGTGKLTIATQLVRLIGKDRAVLIDNHQLIDNVKLPRRHPQYWEARALERQKAFRAYVLAPHMQHKTIIFTDFQTDSDNGTDTSLEYLEAAFRAGRPFLPVSLTCSESENIRRVTNPARCWTEAGGQKNKLTNAFVLRCYLTLSLFDFDEFDCFHEVKRDGVVVDVTELDAVVAAEMILREAKRSRKGKEVVREVGYGW
ncbi:hypothetical protein CKAH01_10548 [Colletotrichum kahawae]|uniref:Uncharacterized protein n=1 Tax=Colletotrichum kahawae TaxID=34407 RepID=A0AAD9XVV7_COLKA|nr:hypothetical protein CKAH01_10548 [Colletotrichum kahawae]